MDIIITAEELAGAPRFVREWIGSLSASQLRLGESDGAAAQAAPKLADLSEDQAGALLEEIRSDHVACQVLFELGRDRPDGQAEPEGLRRVAIADLLHHTRLTDATQLIAVLKRIGAAFRVVGGGDEPLFAVDEAGYLYVSRSTRENIQLLWRRIITGSVLGAEDTQARWPLEPVSALPAAPGGTS